MVDLRYLGLTLIAVFLALAIGLMTGSALGSPDKREGAYESLRQQMDLLRTDVQEVRTENETALRRLEAGEQVSRELLPLAVRGRLQGTVVGVIVCGRLDERPFWGELERALREAGAEVGPVVRIPDRLRSLEPEARTRLARVWGIPDAPAEPQPFEAAGWITRAMERGYPADRMEHLARELGMEMPRKGPVPVRSLLVLTSAPDEERAATLASGAAPEFEVVKAAMDQELRVVAAEPQESKSSAVAALARFNISTVDAIDTAPGQISAVLALAGAVGRFGSKPGTTRAIPSLERP